MKTDNIFDVPKLVKLVVEYTMEQERREKARETWIREHYTAFLRHPNASTKVLGKTVVVALYDRYTGIHIGVASPHGEDKFEHYIGVAVAFAKAMGKCIPDFI